MDTSEQVSYPPSITLDTTNFCNARCPFCPLFVGDSQMDRSIRPATAMSNELFEKILSEIHGWPLRPYSIQMSANGEILQDPKVFDRIREIRKFGCGLNNCAIKSNTA
jgi:MoaA/NifB/PqqE/SkfB family radical SAM enzyme